MVWILHNNDQSYSESQQTAGVREATAPDPVPLEDMQTCIQWPRQSAGLWTLAKRPTEPVAEPVCQMQGGIS